MEQNSEDKDFEELPVEAYREEILKAVYENQIVICIGETGSGKTTRLPLFFLQAGYCSGNRRVAVTQPRRIAAISVAQRVSDERKTEIGRDIGYVVRFDEKVSEQTKIKYMTDGILIRECLSDRLLSNYSVIMLDEAHERSLNTDILFGLLKEACRNRPDLKLVITSATLDTEKFGNYFNHCPIIHIPGRNFPVDIYHSKTKQIMTTTGPANNSYVQAAVDVVMRIHRKDESGHVLVFLTGQEEIERAVALIRAANDENPHPDRELIVLPLYAALPSEAQALIFLKPEVLMQRLNNSHSHHSAIKQEGDKNIKMIRKVIVATNIAETSLTVPQVRFVVDAGYVKQKVFDPSVGGANGGVGGGIEGLLVVPVSKTSALQRAGRAGRTGPGQCYRLYSSECFDDFLDETVPEIQRTALANTVLYLKAIGIRDVINFDFLDRPSTAQVLQALTQLHLLGALDVFGAITPLGIKMSHLPLDPHVSRMLIQASASELSCLEDMVIIAAMLSVENIWITPRTPRHQQNNGSNNAKGGSNGGYRYGLNFGGRESNSSNYHQDRKNIGYGLGSSHAAHGISSTEERAETMHAGLRQPAGDLHTLRHVFLSWSQQGDFRAGWCESHFLHFRAMKQARKIRDHLQQDVQKLRLHDFAMSHPELVPQSSSSSKKDKGRDKVLSLDERISAAIAAGYFMQAAETCHTEGLFKTLVSPVIPSSSGDDDAGERMLVQLHPSCSLQYQSPAPECVVFVELLRGSKVLIRGVTAVSKSVLRAHRRNVPVVPPEQLSSGQLVATPVIERKRQRMEDANGKSQRLEIPTVTPTEVGQTEVRVTEQQQAAVDEAKLRYLQRKKR